MTSDTSLRPVSPLRTRTIEDMTVRGFNEHTRRDYVRHVRSFAASIGRSSGTARLPALVWKIHRLHGAQTWLVQNAAITGDAPGALSRLGADRIQRQCAALPKIT